MLLVGIDWAESDHAVCVMDASGAIQQRLVVPHSAAGLRRLRAAVAEHEPEATAVLIAIERPDGLLVDALLEAGYSVYALNPKVVERYRGRTRTSGAKTDRSDAELLARIVLVDRDRHRPWRPSSPAVQELRALARDDERAGRDQVRLLNRLRQDVLSVFPQALAAFPHLNTIAALSFLERWPSAAAAAQISDAELASLLREHRHGWPTRAAERIRAALQAEALVAPAHLARAKADTIRLTAQQLLLLHRQRSAWEARLRELLDSAAISPGGEVLLSVTGLSTRLAARVLGEMGDQLERFPTPSALQCYAGTAPVTKASGRLRVVTVRFACNRVLRQAVLQWAHCSRQGSSWASAFYTQHRSAGKTHFAALRQPLAGDPPPPAAHRPAVRRAAARAQSCFEAAGRGLIPEG